MLPFARRKTEPAKSAAGGGEGLLTALRGRPADGFGAIPSPAFRAALRALNPPEALSTPAI